MKMLWGAGGGGGWGGVGWGGGGGGGGGRCVRVCSRGFEKSVRSRG